MSVDGTEVWNEEDGGLEFGESTNYVFGECDDAPKPSPTPDAPTPDAGPVSCGSDEISFAMELTTDGWG